MMNLLKLFKRNLVKFAQFSIFNFQFSILILFFLLITSCASESVSTGSISGSVTLENHEDASGTYIAVYDLSVLDPVVVEANEKWPQIGVIINQQTEFDHRLQEPISNTLSDATGLYKLNDIPTGEYNIVFYKAGWGFRYIYNFQVDKGENQVDEVILYEETLLEGDISTDIIMQDAHHYIIEDNANIVPGAKLTIDPGAVVRINPGKSLNIWGEIEAQGTEGNLFWITSNDGFDEFSTKYDPEEIERYNQVMLEENIIITNDMISYGRFDFGTFALSSTGNYFRNNNCVYKYSNCGLQAMDEDSCFASNCNFSNITGSNGGLFFEFILGGKVEKLISVNNEIGLRLKDRFDGIVENNYLAYNTFGIEGVHFTGIIQHNELSSNFDCDIHIAGTWCNVNEPMEIYYNNFNSVTGILRFSLYSYEACRINNINFNNFRNNNYFIFCDSGDSYVDATHNYFNGLNSEAAIREKVSDFNTDIEIYDISGFFTVKVDDCGIQ